MKIALIIMCLMTILNCIAEENGITIYDHDHFKLTGQLLFGTDSILYIWTGLSEFDQETLHYVKAIPFNQISKINLRNSYSWKEGMVNVLPSSVFTGLAVSAFAVGNDDYDKLLVFNAVYNFTYCLVIGGFASIFSHIPKNINEPSQKDFVYLQKKLRKHFLLTKKDQNLINRLLLEVTP